MKKNLYECKNRILAFILSITMIVGIFLPYPTIKVNAAERSGTSDKGNRYLIYPIPQDIEYDENESSFNLSNGVNLVLEEGIDDATKKYVEEVLKGYEISYTIKNGLSPDKTNLCLGINDSNKIVDKYVKDNITIKNENLFENPDAYLMDIKENAIVILGKDSDAAFYGVATLKMVLSSFNNTKLLNAKIEDYASVEVRGFIEGFYGGWNYEERESLMQYAKDYKMNSYVYASKTDQYHTNKWDVLYPEDELAEIAELVKVGEETKVRYAWSVHLSGFFKGLDTSNTTEYEKRYKNLIAKFQQLYDVGVRKFDILNDDFGGGSHDEVVKLLNRLDNEFIQKNGCKRMVYCPQGYNKAWSGNGDELKKLQGLNETIDLYWTGDDVNSPITQETVDFLKEKTNHKPVFWLNYPVNEHSKSGIYLGDISYYARDNVSGMAGFVSNPSRFAESNKVALFQLAALNWNNNNYLENSQKVWEDSFKYLQPEVQDSYLTIARNVANAPRSSRVPGFNESEYLKDKLESVSDKAKRGVLTANDQEVLELISEFDNMSSAIDDMKLNCANKALLEELDPWLNSLKDVATAGKEILNSIIAVLNKDTGAAWNSFRAATKAFETKYSYLTAEDLPNVYAEAGSKRLTPFINNMIKIVKNDIMQIFDVSDTAFTPSIYAVMGGVEQVDSNNTAKMFDGDEGTSASFIINQEEGDYIGVDMGKTVLVENIHILQAKDDTHHDYFHEAVLEYSADGNIWSEIETYNNQVRIDLEGLNFEARYIRLRLIKDKTKPYWTYIREFKVNKEAEKQPRIYTNVELLKETPITISGKQNSICDLSNILLKKNEYIGIKLPEISAVSNLVNKVSKEGLTAQYSINGTTWDNFKGETANLKYIRLINKTDKDINLNIEEFGISVTTLKVSPKFMETNLSNGLKEGEYKNLFDNDLSTFAWTNESQSTGDYITFDLGSISNIYDVNVITADGNPRLYNAEIQISTNNKDWTTIGSVVNDDSVFEVPYRYVRANAEGKEARYLRIYITANSGFYLKLHEIEINKSVKDQIINELDSSLSGDTDKIIDKDISTVFTQKEAVSNEDYIEYTISENTNVDKVLLLQEPAKGVIKIKTKDGYVNISDLNNSVLEVNTSEYDDILAIRLEWEDGQTPSIYELILNKGEDNSDDVGVNVENIIKDDSVDEITNIALKKPVTVSGTSDGNKDFVNDGDDKTKWDSNAIKGNNAAENSWLTIDLGEEKNEITQLIIKYFNKIYPTDYEVQISSDNENWETIKTIEKEPNGPTYPIESIKFDPAISARYVRLLFNELNSGAAGNGVGITEFMIMGRYVKEVEVDYSKLLNLINEVKEKDLTGYTKLSVDTLNTVLEESELLSNNKEATQEQVDIQVEKLQEAVNNLEKKITEEFNIALNKSVEVSGTSNGVKESINDGNKSTKWDSNFIKGDNAAENAWVIIDLGEKQSIISKFNISYFNLVFPTKYKIQISQDKESWITIAEKDHENGGAAHPVDIIELEQEVSARYIRVLFEELNSVAAGNGVGINELEVIGKVINEESELEGIEEFEEKEFIIPVDIKTLGLKELANINVKIEDSTLEFLVPVKWNMSDFDGTIVGNFALKGELQLSNNIKNPQGLKAIQNIILKNEDSEPDEEVDKTKLEEQIEKLSEIVNNIEKYVPESVEGIEELLENAQELYADDNAVQKDVDDMCNKILIAIENAKLKEDKPSEEVDKTELEAQIEKLKEIVNNIDKYVPESVEGIEELLENAQQLYADDNAIQEDVDSICNKISIAIENAKLKEDKPSEEVDKTKLEEQIEKLNELVNNIDKYVPESVEGIEELLENAQQLYADDNAIQEDVDSICNKISIAIENAKLKEDKPSEEVDKTKLGEQIEKLKEIVNNMDKYVPESIEGIEELLENAQRLYADDNAIQKDVDDMCNKISIALENAKLKEDNGNGEGEGDNPNGGNEPDNPDNNKPDEEKPDKNDDSNVNKPEKLPQTGDPYNIMGIMALVFSAVGIRLVSKVKEK